MALYDDYKDKSFVPGDQSWDIDWIYPRIRQNGPMFNSAGDLTGFKLPIQQNERTSLFISGKGRPMLYFPFHYVVFTRSLAIGRVQFYGFIGPSCSICVTHCKYIFIILQHTFCDILTVALTTFLSLCKHSMEK